MSASLFPRCGWWHMKVQLEGWPKEKRFSLGTRDKRVAHAKFEARLQDMEKEAAGLLPALTVREAAKRPLFDLVELFIADMTARDKAAGTVRKYGIVLRRLCAACGWTLLQHVTAASFSEWRKESTLRASTQNHYLATANRFFRWLRRQRLVLENPLEFVEPADLRRSAREYRGSLTAAQVERLLATAPAPRRTFYRLILETAIRPGEIRRLRVCDIITADDRLAGVPLPPAGEGEGARGSPGYHVRIPATIAKNCKTALQPISAQLAQELVALLPPDAHPNAPAFVQQVPLCRTFRKDLLAAGIAPVDAQGRRVDLHALRKTAGTHLVLSGADPRVVMEFMRHSDLKLTMKTYMDAAQLKAPVLAAVARLPWNVAPVADERRATS